MSNEDVSEIGNVVPFTWETQFEKNSRELIRASTQSELIRLRAQYMKTIEQEKWNMKHGEISSSYLREILHRLLEETEGEITKKIEVLKAQTLGITPSFQGELPKWFSWAKLEVLQSGIILIGLQKERNSKKQPIGFTLTPDEYLRKVKGKTIHTNDREVQLHWSATGNPILKCKTIKKLEPSRDQEETKEALTKVQEVPELQKTKAIIAELRRDILTDTSPLTQLLFAWTKKAELDLSRTSFAAWKNQKDTDYAQIMEDEGKIYSIWGKVADGKRPLILVDRQNLVVLFAGSVGKDDAIMASPWFQWPKDRDMKAYRFQPKIPIAWKI